MSKRKEKRALYKTFYDWIKSDEGVSALTISTLGSTNPEYYQRNRLWRAFRAGRDSMLLEVEEYANKK